MPTRRLNIHGVSISYATVAYLNCEIWVVKSRTREESKLEAPPTRRSAEEIVAATLAATYEMLWEAGLGGVSVDEISRRSGVAKTTIYRHWGTRTALLLDACSQLSPKPHAPDTGSLKTDLIELALLIARRLREGRWSSVIPSVIDAAERDPEIAELHSKLHEAMMTAFRTVLVRARDRGENGAEGDPAEVIASIVGPLFYRRWFSREPLTKKFVSAIVERALVKSRTLPQRTGAASSRPRKSRMT
jgi:AcrR family transcriptional regulator